MNIMRNTRPAFVAGLLIGLAVTALAEAASDSRTIHYTYSDFGQVTSVDGSRTDVLDITQYDYDERGNKLSATNALGHLTLYTDYERNGLAGTITDPNGLVTHLSYDWQGKITEQRVEAPQGDLVTEYVYDPVGQLIEIHPSSGPSLFYEYDAAQRLVGLSNSAGERLEYDLDAMGNVLSVQTYDAVGQLMRQHQQAYDGLSRVRERVGGTDQQTTQYDYDANGNRTEIVDPNQNPATRQQFDALNRLIEVTDRATGVTRFDYNSQDRLSVITDPRGVTTRYDYNGFGEITAVHSPDTGATTYEYDHAGNRIRQTDANGQVTEYDYDALNRRTAVRYPSQPERNIQYHYDDTSLDANNVPNAGLGRLTGIVFNGGERQLRFDILGRLTAETRIIDGQAYTSRYRYNAQGQLSAKQLPSGAWLGYHYDDQGQPTRLSLQSSADAGPDQQRTVVDQLETLPFGPLRHLRYGNGIEQTNEYDLDYRLTGQQSSVWDRGYYYDLNTNVEQIVDWQADSDHQTFQYDALDRLIDASGLYGQRQYGYDPVGNREVKADDSNTTHYGYATQSNRLLNEADWFYEYDAAGNLLGNGRFEFSYNEQGHLSQVHDAQTGDLVAEYGYNPNRQRIKKTVPYSDPDYAALADEQQALAEQHQQDDQTTHFLYHTDGTLAGEYDENGTARREYVYLASWPIAVIEPSSTGTTPTDAELYFIHSDHMGTPKVMTDLDQTPVWKATHTPFGKATVQVEETTSNLRFPGQYFDAETGLHYNWNRYYDPATGRYISSDPIGLEGGLNTYGYAYQNPVNYIDPDGQLAFLAFLPFLGGAGATAGGTTAGSGLGFWATGALLGGAVAVATIPGDTPIEDVDADVEEFCPPEDDECPPCETVSGKTVPVGTIAYRPLDTPSRPQHGIDGPHYNILKAQQAPKNTPRPCYCFWQPIGAVSPDQLPPDAIPIEPFAN